MSRSKHIAVSLFVGLVGLGFIAATGTAQADPPRWAHDGWHHEWHHEDDDHGWHGRFIPPPPAYYAPPPAYYAPPRAYYAPPPPVYYAPPPPPPVYFTPPILSFGINVPLGGDDH